MLSSTKGFFSLFKQLIIDLEETHAVHQSVDQNCIPAIVEVKFRKTAAAQKNLRLLQREIKAKAETDDPIAGRIAALGKNLMQIDYAHAGLLNAALRYDLLQKFYNAFHVELGFIFFQKIVQIGGLFYFFPQIVGALCFQCSSAFLRY